MNAQEFIRNKTKLNASLQNKVECEFTVKQSSPNQVKQEPKSCITEKGIRPYALGESETDEEDKGRSKKNPHKSKKSKVRKNNFKPSTEADLKEMNQYTQTNESIEKYLKDQQRKNSLSDASVTSDSSYQSCKSSNSSFVTALDDSSQLCGNKHSKNKSRNKENADSVKNNTYSSKKFYRYVKDDDFEFEKP